MIISYHAAFFYTENRNVRRCLHDKTVIIVVGTFDSYKEEVDGNYYIYLVLRNASFV